MWGDVSGDGVVNILDVVVLVNIVLGNSDSSDNSSCGADMNGDGVINILDITTTIAYILSGGS